MKKTTIKSLKFKVDKILMILKYFYFLFLPVVIVYYVFNINNENIVTSFNIIIFGIIISLLIIFILSYYFEVIFKIEIGFISWKNTLSLSFLIFFLFPLLLGIISINTVLLPPFFIIPIILLVWFFFEQERSIIDSFFKKKK